MTPFAIAGVQMHLQHGDNLDAMRHRLQVMMHLYPWVQMAVFSELCVFGPGLQRAQRLPGPAEDSLRAMAREFDLWLVPGSLYESRDGRIYNTTPIINPNGDVVARYRKMFPFAPLEEGVAPGGEFCVFDVPEVGKFAVLNCYDLWFPETSRTVTAMGAEVILHPVMTHTIDRDVDLNVAKASAAMFQCYVFDINGLDAGGNGQSCVLDPSGRVIHQCGTTEELVPVEVDLEQVRRQRVRGMRTLGQPLKSFRDNTVHFSVYDEDSAALTYLNSLGPLEKPQRGRFAREPEPEPVETLAAE
jgi:predicted amidohydrolase